jgi:hypothetical protein
MWDDNIKIYPKVRGYGLISFWLVLVPAECYFERDKVSFRFIKQANLFINWATINFSRIPLHKMCTENEKTVRNINCTHHVLKWVEISSAVLQQTRHQRLCVLHNFDIILCLWTREEMWCWLQAAQSHGETEWRHEAFLCCKQLSIGAWLPHHQQHISSPEDGRREIFDTLLIYSIVIIILIDTSQTQYCKIRNNKQHANLYAQIF